MSATSRAAGHPAGRSLGVSAMLADCAAVFAVALLVRLVWIGQHSLWVDELFSLNWSHLQPSFLLGRGAQIETNPPAYYLLLHYWTMLVGDRAFALRSLSALASAGSAVTVYAAMRLLFGRTTAWLAAGLLAVNTVSVFFAQETRAYAFVALSNGVMLLALAGYARRFEAGLSRNGWVVLFALAAMASFLFHYTSMLTVAAGFGTASAYLLVRRRPAWRELLVWVLAGLVVAAVIVKPFLIARSLAQSPNLAWIDGLAPWLLRDFLVQMFAHPVPVPAALRLVAYLLGVLLVISVLRSRLDRAQFCVLVLMPGLFAALMLSASISRPILLPRVAEWLELPISMLLAAGIMAWRGRGLRLAMGGLATACLLAELGGYEFGYQTEDWRDAARIVATDARCSGPIINTGPYGLGILYYQPQTASRRFYDLVMVDGDQLTSEHLLGAKVDHATDLNDDQVLALITSQPHAVLVMQPSYGIELMTAAYPAMMATARWTTELPGGLKLACF